MEKKVVAKKKPKSAGKKEETGLKVTDGDGSSHECQTLGETTANRDGSALKTKPKSRKRNMSFEEDIIDGFLMVSYASLEDLEADGPIKPGAILAGKEDISSPNGASPTKKKRESKSLGSKAGKSVLSDGQKKKKNTDKLPKKPRAVKTEKGKAKTKKGKDDSATITKPDAEPTLVTELENKPAEIIHNASETFLLASASSVADNCLQTPIRVSEPQNHARNEEPVSLVTTSQNTPTTPSKDVKEFPMPRKPLSDFSINAIQSMRGTPSISTASASETSGSSTVTTSVAEETETHTKSIATMTSDQRQDKSISPMEVIMRKETGFQFRRFEETKISASIGGISPIKSSLSFDDAVIRKSLHHQIDLTGTTVLNNDKMKSSSTNIKSREILRRDSRSRSPKHHSDAQTPSTTSFSSSKDSTKHQHQHQHIHQHQHSHQHFHPPFGMVPNGVFPPSYYSGIPYLPPMSASAPHSHITKPIPKPGKWCSLHVKIAHYITKAQKEVERANSLNSESVGLNRTGPHAFQAVPSRSNYDREFPFHSAVRPHLSFSPKGIHHTGLLHGSLPRDPERNPYHFQGRPHPYFAAREGLPQKRSDFEHPTPFGGLGHSTSSSYRGLFDRERSSPPHLEAIFPRRNSERTLTDIEKTNHLMQRDRSMLNLSSEREIHHESERHRRSSFMDRDKTAYFQPMKLDAGLCRSSLTSHGILGCETTRKPSPRRAVSPLTSPLVSAQKPHFRGNELFDRFRPDSLEHHGLYGSGSRILGNESRLFGSESRLFGSESRILGGGEPRLFGSDKRLAAPEGRLFGADSRKSLLPFGHNTPLGSSASHSGVLGSLGRMSSKFTSSS